MIDDRAVRRHQYHIASAADLVPAHNVYNMRHREAALAVVFAVGVFFVMRSIKKSASALAKPIMDLNETAQKLASGDLDVVLDVKAPVPLSQARLRCSIPFPHCR